MQADRKLSCTSPGCFLQLINGVGPFEMAEMLEEENVSK